MVPLDCAKGIALITANGGDIRDDEGADRSAQQQLPMIAIDTTAGTASRMTRFCIITDRELHVKMAIVDKYVTPLLSVDDAALMLEMPLLLTAATGMDALTHAVEAYVSTALTTWLPKTYRLWWQTGTMKPHGKIWLMPGLWPAWPSIMPYWDMCTRWLISWAVSTTFLMVSAMPCFYVSFRRTHIDAFFRRVTGSAYE